MEHEWEATIPWQQGEKDGADHHLIIVLRGVGVAKDDDHLHDPAGYENHEAQVDCCAGLQPSISSHSTIVKNLSCTWSACQGTALLSS